jgi:hypothetical protein
MKTQAFTRVELLATLAAAGLLGAVAISVVADTRERSERLMCMNNLRQIGRGFHVWAAEHGGYNPWRVLASEGGTQPLPIAPRTFEVPGIGTFPGAITHNAWFQFLWVYEGLPGPHVLVCPSDSTKQRATNFSTAPGGLAHPSMQNNAVSYVEGLDVFREMSDRVLSGDRNMIATALGGAGCSSGITGFRTIGAPAAGAPPTGWTNGIHGASGNLLINDGRVEQTTTQDFNEYLNGITDDSGYWHVLFP